MPEEEKKQELQPGDEIEINPKIKERLAEMWERIIGMEIGLAQLTTQLGIQRLHFWKLVRAHHPELKEQEMSYDTIREVLLIDFKKPSWRSDVEGMLKRAEARRKRRDAEEGSDTTPPEEEGDSTTS